MLSRLIRNHETAEATYIELSGLPDPPHMELARTVLGLSDQQWEYLSLAYEEDSGRMAASDASDAAYHRMITFIQQLLGVPSTSRGALCLKAKACLFEAPLARLREEGFGGLAILMEQLVALDADDPVIAPAPD